MAAASSRSAAAREKARALLAAADAADACPHSTAPCRCALDAAASTSACSTASLLILLRVRPLNASELAHGDAACVSVPSNVRACVHSLRARYDGETSVTHSPFTFHRVYDPSASQEQVYTTLRPLLAPLPRATVFMFGATGAGKSYTMGGIIQRVLVDLNARAAEQRRFVGVSYFEVYLNRAFDLLHDGAQCEIREDAHGNVHVCGLVEVATRNVTETAAIVASGVARRKSGSTRANASGSSRSHTVMHLVTRDLEPPHALRSKLSLVDIAGAEAAADADFNRDDAAAAEAADINSTTLALKECIRAMGRGVGASVGFGLHRPRSKSSSARRQAKGARAASAPRQHAAVGPSSRSGAPSGHVHIPFRGSRLTHILRDAFNALCVAIACVSPSDHVVEYTRSTIEYASTLARVHAAGGAASEMRLHADAATSPLFDSDAIVHVGTPPPPTVVTVSTAAVAVPEAAVPVRRKAPSAAPPPPASATSAAPPVAPRAMPPPIAPIPPPPLLKRLQVDETAAAPPPRLGAPSARPHTVSHERVRALATSHVSAVASSLLLQPASPPAITRLATVRAVPGYEPTRCMPAAVIEPPLQAMRAPLAPASSAHQRVAAVKERTTPPRQHKPSRKLAPVSPPSAITAVPLAMPMERGRSGVGLALSHARGPRPPPCLPSGQGPALVHILGAGTARGRSSYGGSAAVGGAVVKSGDSKGYRASK